MLRSILITALVAISSNLLAQIENRKIEFPDIDGYKTVIVDLHMHTVFSDGSVWPDVRVYEAIEDGVDLIAMTEHLEYQPHSEDIPHPNRNRAFEIAKKVAENRELAVINGAEITRDMPPGHCNAVFISDANKFLIDDPLEIFQEAQRQEAFTFWNHPHWTSQRKDGVATLTDFHLQLINEGLLHGIEVVNEMTYSDEALQIALEHDLTILGTSDIHGLVDWQFGLYEGGHRPVTMVFARDNSLGEIKQALMDGRTCVWFDNILIGKEQYLVSLVENSLTVVSAEYSDRHNVVPVVVENSTGVDFILKNESDFNFHSDSDVMEIPAHSLKTIEVKTIEKLTAFNLKFQVLNAVIAPDTHPSITIEVKTN